jgi:hypothetical protein
MQSPPPTPVQGPGLPSEDAHNAFFYEIREIQVLPQYLFRERNCQLLLLLLNQRK